jgi:hypothetical protein
VTVAALSTPVWGTPSRLPGLFAQATSLPLPAADTHGGLCALCGDYVAERVSWRPGANWTAASSQAAPHEPAVCRGCALLLGDSPVPAKSGRPLRWTFFSIAASGGNGGGAEARWWSKAEKPAIRRWLLDAAAADGGRAVCVADGGKKHLAYLTPVCEGMLWARFDDHLVPVDDEFRELLGCCDRLVAEKVRRAEITSGAISVSGWSRLSPGARAAWQRVRVGEPCRLLLAVWLAGHTGETS